MSRTLFRKSASMRSSSRSVFSRNSLIFIRVRCLLLDETGLHRELVGGEAHRFAGRLLGDAVHLEQDGAGPDGSDVVVDGALAAAHDALVAVVGDRLVGEDADPDLAAALDEPGHRATGRL